MKPISRICFVALLLVSTAALSQNNTKTLLVAPTSLKTLTLIPTAAQVANQTYTYPDVGANTYFIMGTSTGGQTLAGGLTLSGTVNFSALTASLPLKLDASKNVVSAAIALGGSEVSGTLPIARGGTNSGTALSGNSIMVSDGSGIIQGNTGSATTVLHGNLSFAAVSLTADVSGTLPLTAGGTGQTTAGAAFDALSPMSTLGDVIYGGASGAGTRLAGNTTSAKQFLTQTGTGAVSAAPAWGAIAVADLPTIDVAHGGTGVVTLTAHGVLIGEGTGNVATTTAGTANQVLMSGGASADPAWSTATYPATAGATANRALYTSDGTNFTVGQLPNAALANSAVTVTAGTGLSGGGSVSLGSSTTINVATNGISNALFRQSGALTVVGNGTNATADVSDITAGTDDFVLRRSGTSLAFGQVATGGITNAAVTYAKIQNVAATSLVGNSAGSPAAAENISIGTGLSLASSTLSATGVMSYVTVAAAAAITIPNSTTVVTITDNSALSANVVTMPAGVNGQFLVIYNADADDTATTVIGAGSTASFVYAGGGWQRITP
jgi:hypothetical protein